MSILTAATLAGFTLLGLGWVKSDLADVRTELRTEIAAVNGRIDSVNSRLSSVEERLARIETLLEERLPLAPDPCRCRIAPVPIDCGHLYRQEVASANFKGNM